MLDLAAGSSPLARGTPPGNRPLRVRSRFIPARAGNTTPGAPSAATATVHPRSRGEHWSAERSAAVCPGSSPLARGTPLLRPPLLPAERFIPARAGNTRRTGSRCQPGAVHPRSRGEHSRTTRGGGALCSGSSPLARGTLQDHAGGGGALCSGSSPLARGTRGGGRRRARRLRFIPARAGNTTPEISTARPTSVHPRSRGEHPPPPPPGGPIGGSSPLARGTQAALKAI